MLVFVWHPMTHIISLATMTVSTHIILSFCLADNESMTHNIIALLVPQGVISAETLAEVREQVDLAFRRSQQELLVGPASPSLLLRLLNLPPPGAVELARAAEVFQEVYSRHWQLIQSHLPACYSLLLPPLQALERVRAERIPAGNDSMIPELTPCELRVLAELSGCADHRRVVDCSQSCHLQRYRSHDGTCNNLNRPLQVSHCDYQCRGACAGMH